MNILHVVRQYHPAVGGLESYVRNMVNHQKKFGHKCAVLTLNRVFHGDAKTLPSFETVDDVPVYRVPFIGKRRFFLPLVSPSFFKNYDVVHVHNTDGFFDYISWWAKYSGRSVFATTHGGFFHTKDFSAIKKIYFDLITRHSGKRYKAIFAISQNDLNTFKGVNDNLILRPNAIKPPGDFIASGNNFVYLGRLAKHKNVPAVIETFSVMKTKYGVPGRLHIIGPEWDVRKADLSSLAASLGIAGEVIFHGFLSSKDLELVLRNCGWFMSASTYEGFGMSMLEAMAVGLLPLVHPNASFLELIEKSGIGSCIDFTKPEKAALEIQKEISSGTLKDRNKARNFALQFSWEALADDTISAYRKYGV